MFPSVGASAAGPLPKVAAAVCTGVASAPYPLLFGSCRYPEYGSSSIGHSDRFVLTCYHDNKGEGPQQRYVYTPPSCVIWAS